MRTREKKAWDKRGWMGSALSPHLDGGIQRSSASPAAARRMGRGKTADLRSLIRTRCSTLLRYSTSPARRQGMIPIYIVVDFAR
jgi:hypothetical protein